MYTEYDYLTHRDPADESEFSHGLGDIDGGDDHVNMPSMSEMVFVEETAITIPVHIQHWDQTFPKKAHRTDAAYDLVALWSLSINPGQTQLVDAGFKIVIPDGHVGIICPRSGLALNYSVTVLNAPGIIDPGYRGDVGVILHNAGHLPFYVHAGDRIAQLLIVKLPLVQLERRDTLDDDTDRGEGGFGSTGS